MQHHSTPGVITSSLVRPWTASEPSMRRPLGVNRGTGVKARSNEKPLRHASIRTLDGPQ